MRIATLLCLFLLLAGRVPAFAAEVAGSVTHAETGEPLENVNVTVEGTSLGAVTNIRGEFLLDNVPEGAYTLIVSHVAFRPKRVPFGSAGEARLTFDIELEPAVHMSEGVLVRFDRVEADKATVPFTNITDEELETRYFGQDVPVALEGVPSLTTTTDAGNALGYSYVSMRGIDFKRVGVFLNGVMLNDPEDFYVYWVDLADFGANIEDVQVQRGTGATPYGLPSVGGTISVQTATFSDKPAISAEYGYGSYNTKRGSIHLQSGPIKGDTYLDARFSRITSDGYRDLSWADYFSYYLSGTHVGEKTLTRLVAFGGPIKNHMAYAGVTRDVLKQDRTANPLTYEHETDNYYQPHYQLHHTWNIRDNLALAQTFYYIRGEGYFDVWYPSWWGYSWDFWDLPQLTTTDSTAYPTGWYRMEGGSLAENADGAFFVDFTDAVARQHVNNHQGGWQPRLTWKLPKHELSVGGQAVSHRSRRYGELKWAQALPEGTKPEHVWYDYEGRKRIVTGYVRDRFQVTEDLLLNATVQLTSIEYEVLKNKRFGTSFTQSYLFANPQAGFSWKLAEPWRLWGSYSMVTREPRLKDHYWGETGYPVIRYDDPASFEDPQIQPEKLHDVELGCDWRTGRTAVTANVYWMEMTDEIVDIGEYDVLGQPVIENAAKTRRIGVELGGRVLLPHDLFAEGNLNLAQNRFLEYETATSILDPAGGWGMEVPIDNSGNPIIKAPERIANLALGWRSERGWVRLAAHHVGEQYLDNTQSLEDLQGVNSRDGVTVTGSPSLDQNRRIDAYTRVDLSIGVQMLGATSREALLARSYWPDVELNLHVRNLLDTEYELTGSTDAWGVYIIPAAKRQVMAEVKVTL